MTAAGETSGATGSLYRVKFYLRFVRQLCNLMKDVACHRKVFAGRYGIQVVDFVFAFREHWQRHIVAAKLVETS